MKIIRIVFGFIFIGLGLCIAFIAVAISFIASFVKNTGTKILPQNLRNI